MERDAVGFTGKSDAQPKGSLATTGETPPIEMPWGEMRWLFDAERVAGSTLGVVEIASGQANDRHLHDCEEVLFLVSGELEHELDGRWLHLRAGDAIRIPAGTAHQARNVGDTKARMIVAYNAGRRGFQLAPLDARR